MIIRINQPYLKQAMQEIILNGLQLGKTTVTKGKAIYPTPSGMNIKIPQNPFLNSYNQARIQYHKEIDCDTLLHPIPDGYTKDIGLGFCNRETKEDLILTIAKNAIKPEFGNRFRDLKVKIGELITPPHLYLKGPQLRPHYYIDELWSTGKNTGTNAIKDVVLHSVNDIDTQGRVMLEACSIDGRTSPVGFYYKLGFRATDPETNNRCAKWLAEGGKRYNAPTNSATMYLPKENIQHCLNYGLDTNA